MTAKLYSSIADLRAKNAAAGYNWFSRDTMRFWKTKIESTLTSGRWFISSEDEWAMDGRKPARIYAVREARPDGSIKTIHSHLRSKQEAREIIRTLKREAK